MTDERLRLYVERIERLIEERHGIGNDIRDVFSEAKSAGYDAATIRKLIQRRGMEPHHREEADMLLETYETAIGVGSSASVPSIEELRPDAAAIALNLLTAEIVALEDPDQAASLVEHMLFLLDLRAEIAVLRAQESARKKLAKDEGFEAKQIALAVRWFEKCAKHGVDAMKAGEATFQLYRSTFDARDRPGADISDRDRALMAKFAGRDPAQEKQTARRKRLSGTLAMMNAMDAATKGGGHNG